MCKLVVVSMLHIHSPIQPYVGTQAAYMFSENNRQTENMKNNMFKYLAAVALGAMLLANSALATPTLVIWDDVAAGSVTLVDPTGIAMYVNPTFDNAWSVEIGRAHV